MNKIIRLQQNRIDQNMIQGGQDWSLLLSNKTVDVRVTNLDSSGYTLAVGWNQNAGADKLIPGSSKTYGAAERGFMDNNRLYLNMVAGGAGNLDALVEIWTETDEEIC